ncbi:Hypothetical protein CINCED_3A015693 [Cinara cedri]|uniref:Uncharacterized protein n=1 Tax=Cinara cedri TaxID=506608 RepID=A0A5E4M7I2_9HEMI|nr:Hypothetical protein CINCED_3A015693 [Cinara cedri]
MRRFCRYLEVVLNTRLPFGSHLRTVAKKVPENVTIALGQLMPRLTICEAQAFLCFAGMV